MSPTFQRQSWHNNQQNTRYKVAMNNITLIQPDDWHCHLRDGAALHDIAPYTARQFARAIAMPNLKPPVTTVAEALDYRQRILAACVNYPDFQPLMTLYLTDNSTVEEIEKAAKNPYIFAVKYYPAGATTNSDNGVTHFDKVVDCLRAMERFELPLLLHGEVTDPRVDVFDREAVFIEKHLSWILQRFPALRVVLEHITTKDAVDFVNAAPNNVAATITPQHLLMNRNAMLVGGMQPHHYCLPVLKRESHRLALLGAIASASPKFFLGTDSAPHSIGAKQSACGCAGIFSAHAAMELYACAFEEIQALDKLEAFASFYGADFYRLPRNKKTITLQRQSWEVPTRINFLQDGLHPYYAGQMLPWKFVS